MKQAKNFLQEQTIRGLIQPWMTPMESSELGGGDKEKKENAGRSNLKSKLLRHAEKNN